LNMLKEIEKYAGVEKVSQQFLSKIHQMFSAIKTLVEKNKQLIKACDSFRQRYDDVLVKGDTTQIKQDIQESDNKITISKKYEVPNIGISIEGQVSREAERDTTIKKAIPENFAKSMTEKEEIYSYINVKNYDIDEYYKSIESYCLNREDEVQLPDEQTIKKIDYEDFDIWFQKPGLNNRAQPAEEETEHQISNKSLYVKNISKQATEEDFYEMLVPLFGEDEAQMRKEVTVILMKKGKMRGQGFINCTTPEATKRVQEHLIGFELHGKSLIVQYSKINKK